MKMLLSCHVCSELVPLFAGESSVVLPGLQQSAVEVPV